MRAALASLFLVLVACAAAAPAPAPAPVAPALPAATTPAPASAAAAPAPAPAPSSATLPASGPPPAPTATLEAAPAPSPANTASCPANEVWVPPTPTAGFTMAKGVKGEHPVVLTHGFCMDDNEVTVRAYAACVDAGACKEPWKGDPYSTYPTKLDYPVNLVSWDKAKDFCAWAGKRLPTEAEWEWAATGPEQARYPWGNEPEPSCDLVDYTKFGAPKWEAGGDIGCGGGGPSPVGTHPKGDRVWPGGAIHDLAGNVWEWTEDAFAKYAKDPATDPVVRSEVAVRAIRGGGWNRSYAAMAVTYRGAAHTSYQVPALGFRCVRGEPLPPESPHHEGQR
jgi:formylglycine-generating enzyme required for sulfatase activity